MLITEIVDKKFTHNYSDSGMLIRQIETDTMYADAWDLVPCPYTYEETDTPIEVPELIEEELVENESSENDISIENSAE